MTPEQAEVVERIPRCTRRRPPAELENAAAIAAASRAELARIELAISALDLESRIAARRELAVVEWIHIHAMIEGADGNLSEAARRLGVYRSTLKRRLRKGPPRVLWGGLFR